MVVSDTLLGRAEKPPTTPYDPLPIGPDEVAAGIVRELRALADLGLSDAAALARAVVITAAKIRNSPVLAERQAHDGRCHVCSGSLDDAGPVIAVLSGQPHRGLHMHAGCHGAYRARRAAMVDRIIAAAGYGVAEKREALER